MPHQKLLYPGLGKLPQAHIKYLDDSLGTVWEMGKLNTIAETDHSIPDSDISREETDHRSNEYPPQRYPYDEEPGTSKGLFDIQTFF